LLLEKTRLSAPHPDYHTLLAALMQILHGLILDAWWHTISFSSIGKFAQSNPSLEHLLELGAKVVDSFATPCTDGPEGQATNDPINQNVCLLLQDLIYVAALVWAISDGDFG